MWYKNGNMCTAFVALQQKNLKSLLILSRFLHYHVNLETHFSLKHVQLLVCYKEHRVVICCWVCWSFFCEHCLILSPLLTTLVEEAKRLHVTVLFKYTVKHDLLMLVLMKYSIKTDYESMVHQSWDLCQLFHESFGRKIETNLLNCIQPWQNGTDSMECALVTQF